MYHRPNPNMKWPIQSLEKELEKHQERKKKIRNAVSPWRRNKSVSGSIRMFDSGD